jgi:anti-sigma B factor antagonist
VTLELREQVLDDCHRLIVAGELDVSTAPELEARIARLCTDGANEVVLDLHELSFMDSTGLRLILACRELCESRGCQFSLTRVQPPVQHLFELSGAIDWLSLHGRALAHRIGRRRSPSRVSSGHRPPDLEVTLALDAAAPRSARNYVRDLLRDEPSREVRERALLLTSEVVTSVVPTPADQAAVCDLRVWLRQDLVQVEVAAPSELLPTPPPEETRYDLILLEELADRWTIDQTDPVATICFELRRPRPSRHLP